jgi:hypothetical protein
MIIREVQESDIKSLFKLNKAEVPQVSYIEEDEIRWFMKHAYRFEVAEVNGEIAGMLLVLRNGTEYQSDNYQWFCSRYRDFLYVDRIIVSEEYKRRGIGSAFYYRIIQESSDESIPLTCEVNLEPKNEASLEFHKRLGFAEVGRKHTANGTKLVCMMSRN